MVVVGGWVALEGWGWLVDAVDTKYNLAMIGWWRRQIWFDVIASRPRHSFSNIFDSHF